MRTIESLDRLTRDAQSQSPADWYPVGIMNENDLLPQPQPQSDDKTGSAANV